MENPNSYYEGDITREDLNLKRTSGYSHIDRVKNTSGYSDVDSVSSSPELDYSKELRRKNSFSETSSEEGYYTSTSPELSHREELIPELRSGRPKQLPPLSMRLESMKGKSHMQGLDHLEPLGLSPRTSYHNRPSNSSSKYGPPPPGSPAHPKRPQFKGLSSIVGSLNNLACIPEMEREVSDFSPLSRQKSMAIGGSCNNLVSAIGTDSFRTNNKSKPHHVPPMDLPRRIKTVFSDNVDDTPNRMDFPEPRQDNKIFQIFREFSSSDLLKDCKAKPLFREKSTHDLFKDDISNSLHREHSSERISNIHSRHLYREQSNDMLKDSNQNNKKSNDLLRNGWQMYREPSSHSLNKPELYREPSKDLLMRADHPYLREESALSGLRKQQKKKEKSRKKHQTDLF